MRRSVCVLFILLALFVTTDLLSAQQLPGEEWQVGVQDFGFKLERSDPNPVGPETRIPFELFDDVFDEGRTPRVSARIYNVLLQYVASPTTVDHPAGEGIPLEDLEYPTPGEYEAQWDGRDETGSFVASGVYILEFTVDGVSRMLRMFVTR